MGTAGRHGAVALLSVSVTVYKQGSFEQNKFFCDVLIFGLILFGY